jgi:hypothetical protein
VPLADCRPYPPAPALERLAFGAGRMRGRVGPTVERAGTMVGPVEPPGGQDAAKGVVAV